MIEINNNLLKTPQSNEDGFITSKADKSAHGIGLNAVKKMVRQYGGTMQINVGIDEFKVSVVFNAIRL